MWRVFEADGANQLLRDVLGTLASPEQCDLQSSRAGSTREILHAALTLRNPRDRWVTDRQPALNIAFALAELVWILSGRNDAKFLTYFNHSLRRFVGDDLRLHGAYGDRLRRRFGIDQLDRSYHALQANPQSRQVVLQIWDARADLPSDDGQPSASDIPCNTQSILKVRDHRLEWLQIMRSNDVYLGLPHNLIQFTFLQEVMAGWLGLELGHYHHVSDSLHLYERDAATVTLNPTGEAPPLERFSLPKNDSDRVFATLAAAIDQITDDKYAVDAIARLPDQHNLPGCYRDMLRVLAAEGLRRRRHPELANEVMEHCGCAVFSRMWCNWQMRVNPNRK